jgi:DNA-directed RNA polymerase specialized sigma24 family protein
MHARQSAGWSNKGERSASLYRGIAPISRAPPSGNPLARRHSALVLLSVVALRDTNGVPVSGGRSFETTRWSVVSAARDQLSPTASEALETLCRAYWYPLYAYLRRKGLTAADAQDLTQEFFQRLIEKNYLASVDREQGSFRAFLLASINHLLANEWDKARALKRGGGHEIISLDAEAAEGRFAKEATNQDSPEKSFDRGWALTLLDRALAKLRLENTAAGKLAQFEALKTYLSDVAAAGDYAAVEAQLRLEAGGVAVAVHRLRARYREIVRAEIAQTVATEEEFKAEMRHLFASLD